MSYWKFRIKTFSGWGLIAFYFTNKWNWLIIQCTCISANYILSDFHYFNDFVAGDILRFHLSLEKIPLCGPMAKNILSVWNYNGWKSSRHTTCIIFTGPSCNVSSNGE